MSGQADRLLHSGDLGILLAVVELAGERVNAGRGELGREPGEVEQQRAKPGDSFARLQCQPNQRHA